MVIAVHTQRPDVSSTGRRPGEHILAGLAEGAKPAAVGLFDHPPKVIVDASHVQAVEHQGMRLVPLDEIFTSPEATFIGFGTPNVFLTLPRAAAEDKPAGWDKLAAFMFYRQASYVADTKGRVQGGFFVELQGLPERAQQALRSTMKDEIGYRNCSCANTTARALERAGFTLPGGAKLSSIVLPAKLARAIWTQGLEFEGRPVDLRFISTEPKTLQEHFVGVIKKQLSAPVRAIRKTCGTTPKLKAPQLEPRPLPGARTLDASTAPTMSLYVGRASRLAAMLRNVWGQHPTTKFDMTKPPSTSTPRNLPACRPPCSPSPANGTPAPSSRSLPSAADWGALFATKWHARWSRWAPSARKRWRT